MAVIIQTKKDSIVDSVKSPSWYAKKLASMLGVENKLEELPNFTLVRGANGYGAMYYRDLYLGDTPVVIFKNNSICKTEVDIYSQTIKSWFTSCVKAVSSDTATVVSNLAPQDYPLFSKVEGTSITSVYRVVATGKKGYICVRLKGTSLSVRVVTMEKLTTVGLSHSGGHYSAHFKVDDLSDVAANMLGVIGSLYTSLELNKHVALTTLTPPEKLKELLKGV
jgi:hypothetical protein